MKLSDEAIEAILNVANDNGDEETAALAAEVKRLRLIVQPSARALEVARSFQAKRAQAAASDETPDRPTKIATDADRLRGLEGELTELEAANRNQYERIVELENAVRLAVSQAKGSGSLAAVLATLKGIVR